LYAGNRSIEEDYFPLFLQDEQKLVHGKVEP
jgi:hypothetical protein